MLEIMLNINSEDYDYNMINHVYKTLSEKITDVKFTLNENTLGLLKLGKKKFYNIVKK